MKNNFILFIVLLLSFTGVAQGNYNQFSIEAAYVVSSPYSKSVVNSGLSNGSFTSLGGFKLGGRYMFTTQWGVKGDFTYNDYKGKNNFGTSFSRLDVQAVYSLSEILGLPTLTRESIGLLAHSGIGASYATSRYNTNSNEYVGNFIIGLTPMFKISEKFALSTDISYVLNFKQHNHFDGVPFDPPTVHYETGKTLNLSFGFVYYLGKEKIHADWY